MNNRPIGIIDSGVGGLSIWQKIVSLLPHESTIYLADSKNIPYGEKSQEQIYKFAKLMVEFLIEKEVKTIVVACNTITVCCLSKLREDFPNVPIIGTVPVVKTAAERTKSKNIGILSTESTAKSDYQKNLIQTFAKDCHAICLGANQLVSFVERGETQGGQVDEVLKKTLQEFKNKKVDTIALGCSHFPFLRKAIQKIMGNNVVVLDSGDAIARQTKRVLEKTNNLASQKNPFNTFYTTGKSDQFSNVSSKLLQTVKVDAEEINLGNNFFGKNVGIIGLGIEGISSARFLLKKGAKVTVLDKKEEKDIDRVILSQVKKLNLKLSFGQNYLHDLDSFEIIVRSPGVKRNLRELLAFEENGGIITSPIKIFFDLCPAQIIGVTGTKGKGTTSALIHQMLKEQRYDAYLGGNIGNSPLDFLDRLTSQSWVVLELSSFQLIDLSKSPHIAVMLMTTSEHLDYHKDVSEYVQAKRNILRFQKASDFAIVNKDYIASNESDVCTQGKVFKISREKEIEEGIFIKDESVWLKKDEELLKIIDVSEILLPGKHNLENVGGAVMAATVAGVSLKNIVKVLKEFKGLEHRLELAREVGGVRYYDDSFSTTPETAIAAIESFKNPEILILGGSSKGSDFSQLGQIIGNSKNIKAIIGIGKEWKKIKLKIKLDNPETLIIEGAKDMKTVVAASQKIARPGNVVLLSPACASFDMFKNYKDRGNQFKEEVGKL